jgi:hypothetical protein
MVLKGSQPGCSISRRKGSQRQTGKNAGRLLSGRPRSLACMDGPRLARIFLRAAWKRSGLRRWFCRRLSALRFAARLFGVLGFILGSLALLSADTILGPPRRQFRRNQIGTGNKLSPQPRLDVNRHLDPPPPPSKSTPAISGSMSTVRRRSHAEELAPFDKIVRPQSFERRAKLCQRRINRRRIPGVRLDQNIRVHGCPWLGREGNGIAANDKIFDFAIV